MAHALTICHVGENCPIYKKFARENPNYQGKEMIIIRNQEHYCMALGWLNKKRKRHLGCSLVEILDGINFIASNLENMRGLK